jgi:hypothetical protein
MAATYSPWALGAVGISHLSNFAGDAWANKARTWNTITQGNDGGIKRKELVNPIESIESKDVTLPGQ